MLFSSTVFLFFFLPITVGVYYLLDRKFRNYWLLIVSLLFYGWCEPSFILELVHINAQRPSFGVFFA